MSTEENQTGKKTINVLKPISDIEIMRKLIRDKHFEESRYKKRIENINETLKGKWSANVLYMMWELITWIKKDQGSLLNPVDKDGNLIEYRSGKHLMISTLEFSKYGCYVSIKDSWNRLWIFPVEIFKYKNNFRKMKSIYNKFIKQRTLAELPKEIEDIKKDIKSYQTYIGRANKHMNVINKQLSKLKRDSTLFPLESKDLGFNNEEDD